MPTADELAAVRAVLGAHADKRQQARFVQYLLAICGVHGGESMMSPDSWAFNAGKRWVATTLLGIAEVRLVPMGVRNELEKETDG